MRSPNLDTCLVHHSYRSFHRSVHARTVDGLSTQLIYHFIHGRFAYVKGCFAETRVRPRDRFERVRLRVY